MPVFTLDTNISIETEIKKKLVLDLSKILSKELGKPEQYVEIVLRDNITISFGGTLEPAALCSLSSIGKINANDNRKYSKVISEHLQNILKIPSNRIYINFHDLIPHNVGHNSTTF
jgi:phenylpyruvate tautomerase